MDKMNYSDMVNGQMNFEAERFLNPDNCFYPVFSWIWNDVLDFDEIKRQIDDMYSGGIRCFYIIPEPKNFRPYSMVTKLEPEYLTDEYMEYVRFTAEYAKTKGMYMWLYDEGGWPSGNAAGQVVGQKPELVSKKLARRTVSVKKDSVYTVPKDVKAAFFKGERICDLKKFDCDSEIDEYYIQTKSINPNVVTSADVTERLTSELFTKLTHEKYKKYVGSYFGETIPFMFTDEPTPNMPAFCFDFEQRFKEKYGYDIINYLPVIFKEEGENESENRIRADYFILCGEIFNENYLNYQAVWCEKNNLMLTGHLDNDHSCELSVEHGYTSFPDALSKFHVPGIDVIWRQIDYGKGVTDGTTFFPRLAVSAATLRKSNLTVSESFAVYGSGYTYNEMRYVLNYQFLRGINLINYMAISYGRKDFLAFTERPSFGSEKPGYENLKALNEFTARMSYLSTLGHTCAETLLYLPVRDFYAGGSIKERAVKTFNELGSMLERKGIDFHICDDFSVRNAKSVENGLQIGNICYKYVYIPKNEYMPDDVKIKLEPFVLEAQTVCCCSIGFESVRTTKRCLENGDFLYIFANESSTVSEAQIRFDDNLKYTYELDTVSGKMYFETMSSDVSVMLQSGESKCYLRTDQFIETEVNPQKIIYNHMALLDKFEAAKKKAFILDKTGGYSRYYNIQFNPVKLGSWKTYFGEEFSGDVIYRTTFDLDFEIYGKVKLSFGKVEHSISVDINGVHAGCSIFEPREIFFNTDLFHKGKNIIDITVSNTAANQFILSDAEKYYKSEELGSYHEGAKKSESEHVDGGLYGPVMIQFVK